MPSTLSRRRRSDCPISFALDVFGDRWTLLVIRDLLFKGKRHYQDFCESEEGIATNVLADRLKRLEATGLITRDVAARIAGGVTYHLPTKGLNLAPMLVEMILWSAAHDPHTAAAPEFVETARNDRGALLTKLAASGDPA